MEVLIILGNGASFDSGLNENISHEIMNISYLKKNPVDFWKYYLSLFLKYDSIKKIGPTYQELKEFIKGFHSSTILTQNIDNLALQCKSTNLINIHGLYDNAFCDSCGDQNKILDMPFFSDFKCIYCNCGGLYRPAIVMYDEPFEIKILEYFDISIIMGSSTDYGYLEETIKNLIKKNKEIYIVFIEPDKNKIKMIYNHLKRRKHKNFIYIQSTLYQGISYLDKILRNKEFYNLSNVILKL